MPIGKRIANSTAGDLAARSASLSLASRSMKLKLKTDNNLMREVSERRQVGDTADMFDAKVPWWRNVTMEEGV